MIKAVFFDIDGTLVSFKTHRMPSSTVDALDALRARGVKIFVASGRSLCIIDNLDDYPFDGYVTCNGTLSYADGRVVDRHPIPREDAIFVVDTMMQKHYSAMVYPEGGGMINFRDERFRTVGQVLQLPCPPEGDVEETVRTQPVYEISTFLTVEEEYAWIRPFVKGLSYQRWHPMILDFAPAGVAKGTGLRAILDHYGFSREESMAFGDGGNDIDLLVSAGVGIAMGNAKDDVKALADEVTEDIDSDGLAKALARHGLI